MTSAFLAGKYRMQTCHASILRPSPSELARERGEFRYGQLLRPRSRIDTSVAEKRLGSGDEALEALAKHLSALAEDRSGKRLEVFEVCSDDRRGERLDTHDRGGDAWRRNEGRACDAEQDLRFRTPLREYREAAESAGTGLGH